MRPHRCLLQAQMLKKPALMPKQKSLPCFPKKQYGGNAKSGGTRPAPSGSSSLGKSGGMFPCAAVPLLISSRESGQANNSLEREYKETLTQVAEKGMDYAYSHPNALPNAFGGSLLLTAAMACGTFWSAKKYRRALKQEPGRLNTELLRSYYLFHGNTFASAAILTAATTFMALGKIPQDTIAMVRDAGKLHEVSHVLAASGAVVLSCLGMAVSSWMKSEALIKDNALPRK